MTEPENFIARWSRRKHEAAQEDARTVEDVTAPPAPSLEGGDVAQARRDDLPEHGDRRASAAGTDARTEPAVDLSHLPSLESITAETDIRAFLTPGIPADLARAALRRVWAADPKIRDFVGLAENAWDFNAPDGVPGFGPLQMTDQLRRLVNEIVGGNLPVERNERPAAEVESEAAPRRIESSTETAANTAEWPANNRQDVQTAQDETAASPDESRLGDELPQSREAIIASQHNPEKDEVPQTMERRPHGRALPK